MEFYQEHTRESNQPDKGRLREERSQTTQQPNDTSTSTTTESRTNTINIILSEQPSSLTTKNKRTRRFQRKSSILNLNKYKLQPGELTLLEKGLHFIPTPSREHEAKIVQDFLLFERKLRLHHKLHKEQTQKETTSEEDDSSEEDSPHKLLRPSKGYKPEDHEMDPNIVRFKTTVLNQMKIDLAKKTRPRFNTSKKERQAMKSLKNNKNIIIKPADKGGAIVIQNKEDYIKEGERQLANKEHYMDLETTIKQGRNL